MSQKNLDKWHQVIANKDMKLLREILHQYVEFHSPTLWEPKKGRDITQYILKMVIDIFQDFEYQREWVDGNNLALEFSARVDDKQVRALT